jgi:alkanesulfonate monooxygenase SsuD/methylene tetrahydromethanopterin reductase-like flavin-dependent oxidoreductase (luciferase family)
VQLGLFDIMQIDPLDPADHAEVYRRRLDGLAYADELGFDIAFVAERHYQHFYRTPAPSVWLAAATQRTRTMRLGVLAYTLPLHSPARLAEEIAVLDHLSGGRIEAGFGLGHRVEELVANGIDPARRIAIFQERLAIMEALWSGGQASIESEYNTLNALAINPLPLQTPFPPLWYAGADLAAATWAGHHGMSLALGFAPLDALIPATAAFELGRQRRVQAGGTAAERPGAGRIALMQHVYVSDTDELAMEEMREDLERLAALDPEHQSRPKAERQAMAKAELDQLRQRGTFLAGSAETVAAGIRTAVKTLGIDLFLANVHAGGIDDERVKRTMRLLTTEVRPLLSDLLPRS